MSFTAPFALFALLSVPAVVVLHLFRRRYRPRHVAGLFLFAPDALTAAAGRTRTPLVRSASLWLEIAAAVALSLWLAGPRFLEIGAGMHFVAVLDDSASMGAKGRDGVTFADRARRLLAAELRRVGGEARVTLIATGPRPSVLLGPRAAAGLAEPALAAWHPQRARHDFESALSLAAELGGPTAQVWFVTDTPLPVPLGVAVRAVGESLANASLVHARRLPRDGVEKLFVDATAHADAPLATTLRVRSVGAAQAFAQQAVQLEPGKVARFELDLPADAGAVELLLGGATASDALALDDRHLLLPEPVRPVLVGVRLPDDVAQRLQLAHALRALGSAARAATDVADLEITAAASEGAWVAQLVLEAGAEPFDAWLGPFLFDRRHPLLRGVTLEGVIWGAGTAPAPSGRGLVFAGERALLGEDLLGERVRWTAALATARSNLPTSPDWPILLANMVEQTRARLPGTAQHNLRLGDVLAWRRAPGDDPRAELRLVDASGGVAIGRGARVVTFEPQAVGEHRLLRGEQELDRFAVNFVDAHESDLRRCASAEVAAAPLATEAAPMAAAAAEGVWERRGLLFLLLALVALDWLVLAPRAAARSAA